MVTELRPVVSPAHTLLRWLDGRDGDDHAAMAAARQIVDEAAMALLPDFRRHGFDLDAADALFAHALFQMRDADCVAAQ